VDEEDISLWCHPLQEHATDLKLWTDENHVTNQNQSGNRVDLCVIGLYLLVVSMYVYSCRALPLH